ncbi:DUF192 domain-containing protein [Hydrogenophaga sp. 5NK40-0174]|uniref:DUF192 domain-containing protein n=1 Tax=Hydrogenophaga sp. 5NK40-0174 TaxID=3127649 RepID=UPI00310504FD
MAAACAVALLTTSVHAQQTPQTDLPRVELRAGMYRIHAQVASTHEQVMTGLMYRDSMPDQEGMLFVFPRASVQCFWMRNTRIPLTAAFVADDGTIVNLAKMSPMSEAQHCSDKPVRFVLEMNQGWFEKRKFGPDTRLQGPPFNTKQ